MCHGMGPVTEASLTLEMGPKMTTPLLWPKTLLSSWLWQWMAPGTMCLLFHWWAKWRRASQSCQHLHWETYGRRCGDHFPHLWWSILSLFYEAESWCLPWPNHLQSFFTHLSDPSKKVYFILNLCHMLKWIRITFDEAGTLVDQDGGKKYWQYTD